MKEITWYCKLCGKYGIKHRITHLVDYHKSAPTTTKHSKHYKLIIEFLFLEQIQNKFDLPTPSRVMTYPQMDRKKI